MGGKSDPRLIRRAWELRVHELRTYAYIAEKLGCAVGTAREWYLRGAEAETWVAISDAANDKAALVSFFDHLGSIGLDQLNQGADWAEIAPLLLKIATEKGKVLGLYAPTRVNIRDDREYPAPDPALVAEIRAAVIEARQPLNAGDEES